ncbi:hypothetical protein DLREEDagrD3_28410 [Denitratisoma sp. agr-D3]
MSLAKQQARGWTAICFYPGRVDVARVRFGERKPVVELFHSYSRGESDVQALQRLTPALGLDRQACTTLLPWGGYHLLPVEAPAVPRAELREALRWQIKDMVDFPVDQAGLDLVDIPAPPGGTQRHMVYVAACRRELLVSLIEDFERGGAQLAAIDIPEMAQRNLAALCEHGERGLALLSFDESGGLLTFTARGELYMVRRVDVSLGQLREADDGRWPQLCERVGLEVQRSLDNFDRQFSFVPVQRLLLAPSPVAASLGEFMADYLGMTVDVLDLEDVLDISATSELDDPLRQAQCLATLGAALRQETA